MMISNLKFIYLLLVTFCGFDIIYAQRFIGGLNRDSRKHRNIPGLHIDHTKRRKIGILNRNSRNRCLNRIINGCEVGPGIEALII